MSMNQLLTIGHVLRTESGNAECTVTEYLGGGGQGEVYKATVGGQDMALKWYFLEQATQTQRNSLANLVRKGPPNDRFLWPMDLVASSQQLGFGYLMPLREGRYKGIVDLMRRRIEPSFRALALAGLGLAHSYMQLHSRGLCYRDISFGNAFFDPKTGEVLICDNDNVSVDGDGQGGVYGTQRFMAPEIVRGQARPSTQSDLFSLAVLLFYMLMIHHPLEGKREANIHSLDPAAMNFLYGTNPIFIWDPRDESNRPVRGYQDNAIEYWPIYPQFIRDLFVRSFTDGLRDPENGRVRESEWRTAMAKLHDSVVYCHKCGGENFYDSTLLTSSSAYTGTCWSCKQPVMLPFRIKIGDAIVLLTHDAKLYSHHLSPVGGKGAWDFTKVEAEVAIHPKDPNIWGLKNLSQQKWSTTSSTGQMSDVEPGRSVTLANGTKILFGTVEGIVRR